jgi:hypothetical protein
MNEALSTAAASVGDVLAPDVAYLQPPEERHYVGEATVLAIGSAVLGAFVSGLLAGARDEIREWGRDAGSWLARRLKAIWAGDTRQVLEETDTLVMTWTAEVERTGARSSLVHEAKVTMIFEQSLVEQGLPAASAANVAAAAVRETHRLESQG